ncbi:hypothetical protein GQ43DRAFT_444024, partial [Delitschia confertaspora ATCC 74209]
MPPTKILDSHIHLWPANATSSANHGWMTPGHPLAKRHGISDYNAAVRASSPSVQPKGFVYVETDRFLLSAKPDILHDEVEAVRTGDIAAKQAVKSKLEEWAKEPLEELRFLRRIVEGRSEGEKNDGFEVNDGDEMLAMVIWAPLNLRPALFQMYLEIAADVAGAKTWERVAGFRYLMQGIKQQKEMEELVLGQDWLENLVSQSKGRAGRGWTFDIGVDTRSGGVWQVEVAATMVERARKMEAERGLGSVKFILNHFCKPDLSQAINPNSFRWKAAISRLAAQPNVYMKLSGAFSEFGDNQKAPASREEIVERLEFYVKEVVDRFGSFSCNRIMFGSDWPVCNLGGPKGEQSWGFWREVVDASLGRLKPSIDEALINYSAAMENLWWKAAADAYGIQLGD